MKIIKSFAIGICIFLILNLIVTILSYFNIFKDNIIDIFKILIFIITFISSGIYLGIKVKKKSVLNSSKLSLIYILLSILFIILLPSLEFNLKLLIYYLLIFLLINIGAFIGTNKRRFN